MARLLFWTDLHCEFWGTVPAVPEDAPDYDALLLGGDLATRGQHLAVARQLHRQTGKPVIVVRGNHDFYGRIFDEVVEEDRKLERAMQADGDDVRLLDGTSTVIGDTRIVGATLWTDFRLDERREAAARLAVQKGMTDFEEIRGPDGALMTVADWLDWHERDRKGIERELAKPHDGPTVVMSHHMPLGEMIHPSRRRHPRDLSDAGYASNLHEIFRRHPIDSWFCGHSHDGMKAVVQTPFGAVPVISNPRGYPFETSPFDPTLIVETGVVEPSHQPA